MCRIGHSIEQLDILKNDWKARHSMEWLKIQTLYITARRSVEWIAVQAFYRMPKHTKSFSSYVRYNMSDKASAQTHQAGYKGSVGQGTAAGQSTWTGCAPPPWSQRWCPCIDIHFWVGCLHVPGSRMKTQWKMKLMALTSVFVCDPIKEARAREKKN